jgi:hypothetical protein
MFLRMAKYNVDLACQKLEKNFLMVKRLPEYFNVGFEENFDKFIELIKSGYVYCLPGYDDEGRRVIMIRQTKRDLNKFSSDFGLKTMHFLIAVIVDEPETQIAGCSMIFDLEDMEMKYFLNPMQIKTGMTSLKTGVSVRQKKYYIMNMSKAAQVVVDMCKAFLSEKLKSRIEVLSNVEDLKSKIPTHMLPKEYGGEKPEAEIIEEFVKICEAKKSKLDSIREVEINWDNVPDEKKSNDDYQFEDMGSFRKLEID